MVLVDIFQRIVLAHRHQPAAVVIVQGHVAGGQVLFVVLVDIEYGLAAFGLPDAVDVTVSNDQKINMIAERELLSLTLPEQPLDFFKLGDGFTGMRDLRSIPAGKSVKIAGSVIRYQTPPTRNGNRVVYVIMEDGTGIADVTGFSDTQRKCGGVLFKEGFLVVVGKVQRRGPKSLSIIAEELEPLKGHLTAVYNRVNG